MQGLKSCNSEFRAQSELQTKSSTFTDFSLKLDILHSWKVGAARAQYILKWRIQTCSASQNKNGLKKLLKMQIKCFRVN